MSKPRIIVTGAHGRLGAALVREWKHLGEDVQGFGRAELNLSDSAVLKAKLDELSFDVLVNCAAQTNVDRCEDHVEEAMQLNGHAVGVIGEVCKQKGARCIHISTDYVFAGDKTAPYIEKDEALPISKYGESKLLGEKMLLSASEKHLVARVSWVFGKDRPSFVDQIVKRAMTQEKVDAVCDKIAVPTYTFDAAMLLHPLLYKTPASGILHVCNSGSCTWQEYGQFALDCAVDAGVALKTREVGAQKMSELTAFIARRPPYTVMSTDLLSELIGNPPRDWRDAVREYVNQQAPYL